MSVEHGDPGFDAAAVGRRIRQVRQAKGMSLRELSAKAGLSHGFLSQVERGLSSLALTSMSSVAAALGLSVRDFLAGSPAEADGSYWWIQRGAEAAETLQIGDRYYRFLSKRSAHLQLEPMLVRIHAGERWDREGVHEGEEFAYVLEGELVVTVDGVDHLLGPGDSVHLRSSIPHSIRNDGTATVTVVSVLTPRLS
ncbi:cupin domain-containing protein [Sphaerimonospora mesophila]|uniref:cupin domain-containing protein n=1 Tax=Sphaerimonospora mesophila TaxID=37483 RepID=UPI0006E450E7